LIFEAVAARNAFVVLARAAGAIGGNATRFEIRAQIAKRIARGTAAIDVGLGAVLGAIDARNASAVRAIAVFAISVGRTLLAVRTCLWSGEGVARSTAIDIRLGAVQHAVGARRGLAQIQFAHAARTIACHQATHVVAARIE
jgi:hypothetical protein